MQRIGIFSFYEKNGVVDSYIEYLLKDLKKCLRKLIIVVNGDLSQEGRIIFENIAEDVILRENMGFDVAAYKNVLLEHITFKELVEFSEVVLCNNTFLGPFESFSVIFEKMDKRKNDYWGFNKVEGKLFKHIQSYFLVFREKIIKSGDLISFFSSINSNILFREEVFVRFEVNLYNYMEEKGYYGDSLVYTQNIDIYRNPYLCYKKYQLPVLKIKFFSDTYFDKDILGELLQELQKKGKYPLENILQYIEDRCHLRIDMEEVSKSSNEGDEIEKEIMVELPQIEDVVIRNFIEKFGRVYIYGTGILAKKIWFYFDQYHDRIDGFIISDDQKLIGDSLFGCPIYYYSQVRQASALILALNKENTKKVQPLIREQDTILCLWNWNKD